MKNLIIDATKEEVFFSVITNSQSYNTSYINSRENFDKFMKLLIDFFNKKKFKIVDIDRIYVHLGPGKFTSLRISLSIAKAISLVNNATLVGFKSKDLINKNYKNLIKLNKNKSLIKPVYSS